MHRITNLKLLVV